ncbi:hypothetical protein, partial [Verrucosispora sp. SN26_14.1]|uniref:hypothetical protein n=1 Tax=Verrucosispora sp. SN26_14.1 TaxID=2527879 RepID=UPI001F1A0D13
ARPGPTGTAGGTPGTPPTPLVLRSGCGAAWRGGPAVLVAEVRRIRPRWCREVPQVRRRWC